jgi:hypothetical protein
MPRHAAIGTTLFGLRHGRLEPGLAKARGGKPLLKSELLEVIANGESSGVEFKRDALDITFQKRRFLTLLNEYDANILQSHLALS